MNYSLPGAPTADRKAEGMRYLPLYVFASFYFSLGRSHLCLRVRLIGNDELLLFVVSIDDSPGYEANTSYFILTGL